MALLSALAPYLPALKEFFATASAKSTAWLQVAATKGTVWELIAFAEESLGPANARYAVYALYALAGLFAVSILRSLVAVFWTPAGAATAIRKSKKSASPADAAAASKGAKKSGTAATSDAPAAAAVPVVVPRLPVERIAQQQQVAESRTRPLAASDPTSAIRGFPRVGALAVSPCQQHLILSCRKSLKCVLYPQNKKRQFMEKGKELQGQHFVSLAPAMLGGGDAAAKVDVPSVAFSADGQFVALAESITDAVYVVKLQPTPALVWAAKLPKGRLASQLHAGRWSLCSAQQPATSHASSAPDALVVVADKDAALEVLVRVAGATAAAPGSFKLLTNKFKIGHAAAWALSGTTVAVGGTFLREVRMATVHVRDVSSAMALDKRFVWAPRAVKVRALAVIAARAAAGNTRSLLACFYDDGFGEVLDTSCDDGPDIKAVASFQDDDFATACKPGGCHIVAAVGGQAYHEELSLALWSPRGDVSVWRGVPSAADASTDSCQPFAMCHVADLHDTHDGQAVLAVQFIQHGLGIATSGDNDDRHVRLWTLPATAGGK